jgi:hypothetical protein
MGHRFRCRDEWRLAVCVGLSQNIHHGAECTKDAGNRDALPRLLLKKSPPEPFLGCPAIVNYRQSDQSPSLIHVSQLKSAIVHRWSNG